MTSPSHRRLPIRFLASFLILFTATAAAHAAESFTYTSLVDSRGALKEFDAFFPSINNNGAVVFHAKFPSSNSQPAGEGIYIAEGSGYRGIAVTGGVYERFYANPAINDDGKIAFQANLKDGSEGIFVGDGRTMGNQTIATSASGRLYQFSLMIRFSDYGPAIDGNGTAVFRAQLQSSQKPGLFSGNGSAQEKQLYPPSGSTDGYVDTISPAANSRGDVVFSTGGELRRTTVAGGASVVIATTAPNSPFESFQGTFSINDAGVVAFAAKLKAGGYGVYTADGQGAPQTVIDTNAQPAFSRFRSASINNTGSVACGAFFPSGASNIYVIGPSGGKAVLSPELFGSTIAGFYADVSPRALNDAGQFVFWYELADGRQGIAVATPNNGVQTKTLGNISTRLAVSGGENALIGGLIITGPQNKRVIIRALGPSLQEAGVDNALADPVLDLYGSDGKIITRNDSWKESQQTEIQNTGVAPKKDLEAAIVRTLTPGSYTAVVSGKSGGTGVALVEAYDLDQGANSKLVNISTRGFVSTGENVLIGGFIAGPYTRTVVRAIGPSLADAGVTNALADPTLMVVNSQGVVVASNNNWKETQRAEIEAIGIEPKKDLESALVTTLQSGSYTAVVRGLGGKTGVGLVEVYNLQ